MCRAAAGVNTREFITGCIEAHGFRKSLAVRAGERGERKRLMEWSSASLRPLGFVGQNANLPVTVEKGRETGRDMEQVWDRHTPGCTSGLGEVMIRACV